MYNYVFESLQFRMSWYTSQILTLKLQSILSLYGCNLVFLWWNLQPSATIKIQITALIRMSFTISIQGTSSIDGHRCVYPLFSHASIFFQIISSFRRSRYSTPLLDPGARRAHTCIPGKWANIFGPLCPEKGKNLITHTLIMDPFLWLSSCLFRVSMEWILNILIDILPYSIFISAASLWIGKLRFRNWNTVIHKLANNTFLSNISTGF